MKKVCIILLTLPLVVSCRSKKQVEEARKISGIRTETSDIIISDSAAKQTRGVRLGGSWIVPNHVILENISAPANIHKYNQLLHGTDLEETLAGKGPFTLFIPSDTAFQKLEPALMQQLLTVSAKDLRTELIEHHLVSGKIVTADLEDGVVLKAADGHHLQVKNNGHTIKIDGAEILVKDGVSNNGVVHILDRVLLPETK